MKNIYLPTAEELVEIRTLNESRKNVLLIICDYGDDCIGVDANDIDLPEFSAYKAKVEKVDGKVKADRVAIIDETIEFGSQVVEEAEFKKPK